MAKFPGPKSQRMLDEIGRYVIAQPQPFVLDLERCEGMYLVTVEGERIFDCAGYYGSKLISHNHPRLREPAYLRRLAVAANNKTANPDFLTPECLEYYRLIHGLAPACMKNDRLEVYAINSGAEAVENMMKYMINLHHHKQRRAERESRIHRFIYFDQAFHGRTVFALNVTQMAQAPGITRDFHGLVSGGNIQTAFPAVDTDKPREENERIARQRLDEVDALLKRFGDEVVGIVVEPLQGAGGQRVALPEFFRGLSELANKHDVYLGFDEVQTAGGQTGAFFAADLFGLPYPPQVVATGKKLGCGAVYMLYPMEDRGILDSTWGGTLADMVRFVQEMKVVRDERLIEQVPEKTAILVAGLEDIARRFRSSIHNPRGLGLYQGFSLHTPAERDAFLTDALEQENLLLLSAGRRSVRFRPPLDVTTDDIRLLLDKLARVLGSMANA